MQKNPLLPYIAILLIVFTFSSCSKKHPKITSQKAMQRLMEGNERYINGASLHINQNEERREAIVSKHTPYAVIVGCSDSRVSPEIIFDEGLGHLFVVRVAGNVIGPIELDSIEYSAIHLNSSAILILGHENCGAVNAVVQKNTADIKEVAKLIEPAVTEARESKTSNLLEKAIKINALKMKEFLEKSPNIEKLIKNKKIEVHAAYYNLKTGRVELLSQ